MIVYAESQKKKKKKFRFIKINFHIKFQDHYFTGRANFSGDIA